MTTVKDSNLRHLKEKSAPGRQYKNLEARRPLNIVPKGEGRLRRRNRHSRPKSRGEN